MNKVGHPSGDQGDQPVRQRQPKGGGGGARQLCEVPNSVKDEHIQITFSPAKSRPATPMLIKKKRAIIPDGLLNFRKSFTFYLLNSLFLLIFLSLSLSSCFL